MQQGKIVITGGAGFIGSKLGYKLHKDGYEVLLLDDLSSGYEHNLSIDGESFGEFVKADITSAGLEKYFDGADCVFHFAAISALPVCQSDPGKAISVNTAGTANILEAARKAGVRRLVFASTSAIYENNTNFPCKEDDNVSPNLVYSVSKLNAETLCKAFSQVYGMEIVITRYYNVYGPHQDIVRKSPPFVGYVIKELLNGRAPAFHSDGEQKRDYVFIDDVNALNILCMTHPKAAGGIFNVASGESYSVNQIFNIISSLMGTSITPTFREPEKFWDKYPELYQGKYPLDGKRLAKEVNKFSLGSTKAAEEKLGWRAVTSINDGLARTVEHARRTLKG